MILHPQKQEKKYLVQANPHLGAVGNRSHRGIEVCLWEKVGALAQMPRLEPRHQHRGEQARLAAPTHDAPGGREAVRVGRDVERFERWDGLTV